MYGFGDASVSDAAFGFENLIRASSRFGRFVAFTHSLLPTGTSNTRRLDLDLPAHATVESWLAVSWVITLTQAPNSRLIQL